MDLVNQWLERQEGTQKVLAKQLGVQASKFSEWRHGKRKPGSEAIRAMLREVIPALFQEYKRPVSQELANRLADRLTPEPGAGLVETWRGIEQESDLARRLQEPIETYHISNWRRGRARLPMRVMEAMIRGILPSLLEQEGVETHGISSAQWDRIAEALTPPYRVG